MHAEDRGEAGDDDGAPEERWEAGRRVVPVRGRSGGGRSEAGRPAMAEAVGENIHRERKRGRESARYLIGGGWRNVGGGLQWAEEGRGVLLDALDGTRVVEVAGSRARSGEAMEVVLVAPTAGGDGDGGGQSGPTLGSLRRFVDVLDLSLGGLRALEKKVVVGGGEHLLRRPAVARWPGEMAEKLGMQLGVR